MPANVQSLEAISVVRSALVTFRDDLDQAISAIDLEMRKVLDWLEHDRPSYWRRQLRESHDAVNQARQALHRCLMFPINDERPSCYEERAELKKAEARLAYCDEKAERLRHWVREVRHEMSEYQGRISQLKDLVEIDAPQAMLILDRLLTRLHEYQSIRRTTDGLAAAVASESFARELIPNSVQLPPAELAAPSVAEPENPDEEEA